MDKLLILDLDETLIKSYVIFEKEEKEEEKEEEKKEETKEENFFIAKDGTFTYKVYKRPLLKEFLEFCFSNFKVGIWSASDIRYINCILDGILTKEQKEKLHCVYSFDQCTKKIVGFPDRETLILKNLNKLWRNGSYNKTNTLVIDDTPMTYKNNIGNAIPIDKWDRIKDKELTRVMDRLKILKNRNDVRFPNQSEFVMD